MKPGDAIVLGLCSYVLVGLIFYALRPESGALQYLRKRFSEMTGARRGLEMGSIIAHAFLWPIVAIRLMGPGSPRLRVEGLKCPCGGTYVTTRKIVEHSSLIGIIVGKCVSCKKFREMPQGVTFAAAPEYQKERL